MHARLRGSHAHPSRPSHRTRARLARLGAGLAVATGGLLAGAVTAPAAVAAPLEVEPCPPDTVTVVVDSTELGGTIESGCAEAGGSGTDALLAAGFTETRDPAGYICAVGGLPDPCPAEFTGSFWSYWHGDPDTGWQSYDVGSDDSAPEPGGVEGWRYGDGSTTPGVEPPAAPAAESEAASDADTDAEADTQSGAEPEAGSDAVSTTDEAPDTAEAAASDAVEPAGGISPAAIVGIGLVAVLLVAALVLARRRSGLSRGDGPAGQD